MKNHPSKKLVLAAGLLIALAAGDAYAAGGPGKKGSYAKGGKNESPAVTIDTTKNNTADTAFNTDLINEDLLRMMDQLNGLFRRQEVAGQTNAMYLASQLHNMFAAQSGQGTLASLGTPQSQQGYMETSLGYVTYGISGTNEGEVRRSFQNMKNYKCGENDAANTSVDAYCTLVVACRSQTLDQRQQQNMCPRFMGGLGNGKKFAAYRPDKDGKDLLIKVQAGGGAECQGAGSNPAMLRNRETGAKVEQGHCDTKATAVWAMITGVGKQASVRQMAMGAKDINELLVAEAAAAEKGKRAYYRTDERGNRLLTFAAASSGSELSREAMIELTGEITDGLATNDVVNFTACNSTLPNRGEDLNRASCESFEASERARCPREPGYHVSREGGGRMLTAAFGHAGRSGAREAQPPGERTRSLQATNTNVQLAALNSSQACRGTFESGQTIARSADQLAAIVRSPQFAYFIDHMDEKTKQEYWAAAGRYLDEFGHQVAMNQREMRFEEEGVTFFAENEETIRKQTSLASLFRDSGVDIASLTPIVNGNKYAALVPLKSDILVAPASIMQAKNLQEPQSLLKLISTASIPVAPAKQ